jgi:hypothetical protein
LWKVIVDLSLPRTSAGFSFSSVRVVVLANLERWAVRSWKLSLSEGQCHGRSQACRHRLTGLAGDRGARGGARRQTVAHFGQAARDMVPSSVVLTCENVVKYSRTSLRLHYIIIKAPRAPIKTYLQCAIRRDAMVTYTETAQNIFLSAHGASRQLKWPKSANLSNSSSYPRVS